MWFVSSLLNSMDTHKHRRQVKLSIKKTSIWFLVNSDPIHWWKKYYLSYYSNYPKFSESKRLIVFMVFSPFSLFLLRSGITLSTTTIIIVSIILLILGFVVGGFITTCYSASCSQVHKLLPSIWVAPRYINCSQVYELLPGI